MKLSFLPLVVLVVFATAGCDSSFSTPNSAVGATNQGTQSSDSKSSSNYVQSQSYSDSVGDFDISGTLGLVVATCGGCSGAWYAAEGVTDYTGTQSQYPGEHKVEVRLKVNGTNIGTYSSGKGCVNSLISSSYVYSGWAQAMQISNQEKDPCAPYFEYEAGDVAEVEISHEWPGGGDTRTLTHQF